MSTRVIPLNDAGKLVVPLLPLIVTVPTTVLPEYARQRPDPPPRGSRLERVNAEPFVISIRPRFEQQLEWA